MNAVVSVKKLSTAYSNGNKTMVIFHKMPRSSLQKEDKQRVPYTMAEFKNS